mmetsp:Transcript_11009/g.14318  ORF Transcript_11009/g.14318 Transcript_11009/m.14318 type:complete len:573 (+) Transcript_11009:54-1772(+)
MLQETRTALITGLLCGSIIGWYFTRRRYQELEAAMPPTPSKLKLDVKFSQSSEPTSPRIDLAVTSRMLVRSWSRNKLNQTKKDLRMSIAPKMAALTPPSNHKYVLAMVGLPARGKSFIVKMIMRYLRWTGITAEIFNVGNYRRKMNMGDASANFFDCSNESAQKQREDLAVFVQEDMYKWLEAQEGMAVAFFDATNTTRARRQAILNRARGEKDVVLLFVESICDDPVILDRNYKSKCKNGDYKNQDPQVAIADFKERVKNYEEVYEELLDDEDKGRISFIKIYNVGQKVVTRMCSGYIPSQVAFHLMNVHISPRKIWLSRHSEGTDQLKGLIGGNSGVMTPYGARYAIELQKFIRQKLEQMKKDKENADEDFRGDELVVMLGTHPIHISTVNVLKQECAKDKNVTFMHNSVLNELRGGELDGMTQADVKKKFPELWNERMKDKLHFRYPGNGGESYIDLIQRIKPVIVELERQHKSVLVVTHLAVLRCIYTYFSGAPIEELPMLSMPSHVITELNIEPQGTTKTFTKLGEVSPEICAVGKLALGELHQSNHTGHRTQRTHHRPQPVKTTRR